MRLKNQIAVITGGAAGIGKAIATRLHQEGASVVIADINADLAKDAATELSGLAVQTDVTQSSSVNVLVETVKQHYGRIDILINNAGIHIQKLATDLTDEDWDAIQNTNARGCFYTCRAAAKMMMKQESGRIINIITRLGGNPFSSAYIASKSATWGFTQCLALELAPYNITVNAVAPGHIGVGTGMEKWFRAKAELLGQDWQTFEKNVLKTIPLGRWCTPEDVAATVAFAVSGEAGFTTGECFNVTGGWTGYGTTPPQERGHMIDIKPSDIIGRLLRQETPEALGVSTLDHVEAAMDAGNLPLAKERLEYARFEWQVVHDMYVNWSWSFFTYVQKKDGDAGLEKDYRDILGSYYRSRYDAVMAASPETQLQLSVEGLRGHLMGEGRRGDVPVTDEGKRWRIDLQPCGSGGVAIKRIREGKEANPQLFGFAQEAHDWTWGKKNVCHYCGHCAFVNEILAIENYGHPMRVTEYSGADDGHCTWYIYKDPKDIPAEYYERVGKEAPAHAPRLSDEAKT